MEQNFYSDPAHNLVCRYRFTCGAQKCPSPPDTYEKPSCHVDRFRRYQPQNENRRYYRSWEEVNRITWREVFSFQESWIYMLLLITIVVFLFMVMVLIKLVLKYWH